MSHTYAPGCFRYTRGHKFVAQENRGVDARKCLLQHTFFSFSFAYSAKITSLWLKTLGMSKLSRVFEVLQAVAHRLISFSQSETGGVTPSLTQKNTQFRQAGSELMKFRCHNIDTVAFTRSLSFFSRVHY